MVHVALDGEKSWNVQKVKFLLDWGNKLNSGLPVNVFPFFVNYSLPISIKWDNQLILSVKSANKICKQHFSETDD